MGDILTVSFNEIIQLKAQTRGFSKADTLGVTLPTGLPNLFTGFDKDAEVTEQV